MLKAARLVRPLLSSSAVWDHSCLVPAHRINPLLKQPVPSLWKPTVGVRSMMLNEDSNRVITPGIEAAFKKRDNIPPDYNIIYRAPLQYYITVTYFTAWIAITTVPVILACIYFWGDQTEPIILNDMPLFETNTEAYIMTGMLLLIILNVAHTVSKYPFRIYRNAKENKYIAVFQHTLPGLIRKKEFMAGEAKKVKSFLFPEAVYAIKKKKILLVVDHFLTPAELERMLVDPKQNDPAEIRKRRSRMV